MRTVSLVVVLAAFVRVNAAPNPQTPKGSGNMPKLGTSPVAYGPKPSGCSAFEILVGRGTSEIGRFGVIVGDPLVRSVSQAVPGARGYAVQYPADATSASVPTGTNDTVQRLIFQDKACPNQKFALVGYSQGAMVMRLAAPKIPANILPKILALVMFGDPGLRSGRFGTPFPAPLQGRLFENCAPKDPVCSEGSDFNPHLTYNSAGTTYQRDSTNFIVAAFKGNPLPPKTTVPSSGQGASSAKGGGSPKSATPPKGVSSPKGGTSGGSPPVVVQPKGLALGDAPLAKRHVRDIAMALIAGGDG